MVHVRHWTIRNLAEGGTGYVNSGPQNLTGARYPVGQFIGSVIRDQPQYVFVAAGINDRTSVEDDHAVSFAQFQTIVNKDYDRLKAGLPGAKIVVIGPFWPRQGTTPGIVRINEIVKAAAASHGFPFLDPLGEHWITGTRDVPSSGNAARYILPDGTHPTPAGHRYLAERVLTDLKRLGV